MRRFRHADSSGWGWGVRGLEGLGEGSATRLESAYGCAQSESPVRVASPSRLSESPVRVASPSRQSESPVRVTSPSRQSESPVQVVYPGSREDEGAPGMTRMREEGLG